MATDSRPRSIASSKRHGSAIYEIIEVGRGNIIHAMGAKCPSHDILTQSVFAKKHVPRATTGNPPALAMTGRRDMMAGRAFAAFNHDPEDADSLLRVNNTMRTIMTARKALIFNDENASVRTMFPPKKLWNPIDIPRRE